MYIRTKIVFCAVVAILAASIGHSQTSAADDDEDIQSWNDFQLTVPLTKHFDFVTGVTMRIGDNVSSLTEGKYTIGYTWKPTRSFSIFPFYQYIQARNSAGRFQIENRLSLRGTYKFPTKGFGLSHRSTFEYRMRRSGDSWRWRPSFTVDKELSEKIIPKAKFFVTDEVFFDSTRDRFTRNRLSVGITKTLSKTTAVDIYYMRQGDNFARPGGINIIGTSWKVKL